MIAMLYYITVKWCHVVLVLTLKVRGEGQLARTYENVILLHKIPKKVGFLTDGN